MSQTSSAKAATEGDALPPRPFGRLRPHGEDKAGSPPLLPGGGTHLGLGGEAGNDGDGVTRTPFDSAKTFIGPQGTYYDERWRWMEWRGKTTSWNWPAALTFGGWLGYRRLHGWAALSFGGLSLLFLLAITGTPIRLLAVPLAATAWALGRYGNTLYRNSFRRAAVDVASAHLVHSERIAALRAAGGVDRRAVWLMALAGLLAVSGLAWVALRLGVFEIAW